MRAFIHDDFMLNTKPAQKLYHDFAKEMPIFDFHCHLSPQEIAEDHSYANMAEIWLHGDHYKWRAMRTYGVDERFITGDASDEEKFKAWSKTVPYTIGNPLYHWTHLELKRYFDTDELLNSASAPKIWEHCNTQLASSNFSARNIIERSNVKAIFTTDDPIDSLTFHNAIRDASHFNVKVRPTFRPDNVIDIQKDTFVKYIERLGDVANISITDVAGLMRAITSRAKFFHEAGCRASDHGIATLPSSPCTEEEANAVFLKKMNGDTVTATEADKYETFIMIFLGRLYDSLDWVMQLHLGAIRNNNERMFGKLGPDTGYDSIYDFHLGKALNGYFNELEKSDELPKTIVYNLNPAHNMVIATAIGNFQKGSCKGKIQFGSGWWFNDQKDGMIRQLTDLANTGLLSTFVGMLTDSRSFLSYTRHEYFRRILCNLLGQWMEAGEVPEDYKLLGEIVQGICFNNAERYFNLS
ncbi:glucuronate isomerase [Salipaludibacillus agaradhaerens]|uniref:glucuronate isomerase n=1 Tax=Salipaludibacillus agaradhaerens TaxID=76935 RepID=UPI0009962533|nr:glucuronate isomerase [Salipaludibacillus agaradhaerens]